MNIGNISPVVVAGDKIIGSRACATLTGNIFAENIVNYKAGSATCLNNTFVGDIIFAAMPQRCVRKNCSFDQELFHFALNC